MTEDPSEAVCTLVSLPIDTRYARRGHYFQVPIMENWLPYLAQIVFLWGAFEKKWDEFLGAMFIVAGTIPDTDWKRRKGKKRHAMFLSEIGKVFPEQSDAARYLRNLVEHSIALQKKRNLLVHGRVHLVMGPTPVLVVEDVDHSEPTRTEFSELDIQKLFYDISELTGRFTPLMIPEAHSQILSSRGKSELREFWLKIRQMQTTQATPEPQPQSSEA